MESASSITAAWNSRCTWSSDAQRHLIAQRVEADLVGRGVGDVAGVRRAARFGRHSLLDAAHGQPEIFVDAAHPAGVAARQIVVDRHDVHAAPAARQPCHGRGASQCLAFACLHLDDASARQPERSLQLHIEHFQLEHARRHDADDGDRLQQVLRVTERGAESVLVECAELALTPPDDGDFFAEASVRGENSDRKNPRMGIY